MMNRLIQSYPHNIAQLCLMLVFLHIHISGSPLMCAGIYSCSAWSIVACCSWLAFYILAHAILCFQCVCNLISTFIFGSAIYHFLHLRFWCLCNGRHPKLAVATWWSCHYDSGLVWCGMMWPRHAEADFLPKQTSIVLEDLKEIAFTLFYICWSDKLDKQTQQNGVLEAGCAW